eukprot:TRINITY_DN29344_c0_g1_i1.p1 TRINITY_DN29344_c0_g1~~TRINITY_DN29344_c0_g1_i1.p1  ORF type:complete len:345 (-),score=55.45 TRINITY_DN29344_c0_g1_i1:194-1228(-)
MTVEEVVVAADTLLGPSKSSKSLRFKDDVLRLSGVTSWARKALLRKAHRKLSSKRLPATRPQALQSGCITPRSSRRAPSAFRARWPRWCESEPKSSTEEEAELIRDWLANVPEDAVISIHKDVPRTLPDQLGDLAQHRLQRLLFLAAGSRPEVGYCQGMNYVAAIFVLQEYPEAKAIRSLTKLLDMCCPGYHGPDLSGWRRDAMVLGALVRRCLAEGVWQALEALQIPLELLAADHFLTLTSRSWPMEATLQLWDLMHSEGPSTLFAAFLAVLDLYLPRLKKAEKCKLRTISTFEEAMMHGLKNDLPKVMATIRGLIPMISSSLLDHLRWIYSGSVPEKNATGH